MAKHKRLANRPKSKKLKAKMWYNLEISISFKKNGPHIFNFIINFKAYMSCVFKIKKKKCIKMLKCWHIKWHSFSIIIEYLIYWL